ncbi:hypothetical protein C2845_PM07G08220 [Panicum miliaceum]|uniref:Uncharacterized protein n=1 Tax=Panicum miliaceum TaxID=4540 RepID=A0A3L6SRD0_PANMI|nr:hypothetical protein C2845_PM07G08220 [Panicum miliaceum]
MAAMAPNIIEEEPVPVLPANLQPEVPVVQPELPPVVQALQDPFEFPANFLVEEFPEDMLMDGEASSEEEAGHDHPPEEHIQPEHHENLQLGLVEIFDSHTVDPGLVSFWASQNSSFANAQAIRLWANHFKDINSAHASVSIPVKWCNFFTKLLLPPTHFNWASDFLQSQAWSLFNSNMGRVLFSIPHSCPLTSELLCQQLVLSSNMGSRGKALMEDLTPPSSPSQFPSEVDIMSRNKRKNKKAEIIVDSSVRRSLRVKKAQNGFKASPCTGKNCLACDSDPPAISPSIIKNLGVVFCKIEEEKLSLTNLWKRKVKTKSTIGTKAKKGGKHGSTSEQPAPDNAKMKKKQNTSQRSMESAIPEGTQQQKVKEKKEKHITNAEKKLKK